ncbi:hypothetical protein F5148DRAFT_1368966 [Russula earlei]|uniref:Uncharacterized protein n=1 Tax=Russula earlei TaxID=71964 RepID=A0ACC0U596_9AGAM|nr:hypothetical protein F5148DRAFT_1368966 [Russula earlei]
MSPHFLDLSTELVIQILAYASLHDIGACARTSRRLHDIISGSQYIRYLVLTKLAGMGDPFIPGLSIQERIAILERWERAWHDLDLRKPALHSMWTIAPWDTAMLTCTDVAKRGYVSWTNVDLRQSLFVFSYCFNVEEYNLAVMLVYNPEEHPEPAASLRVLDFSKGTDHPLATTPNILLRFRETTINIYDAHDAHMEVAGDNVVVMITQSRALSDYVFLVGWKSGSVSLIMTAPDLTYATSFSLIDTELLALVNLRMNTVEIHRVQHGPSCALQSLHEPTCPRAPLALDTSHFALPLMPVWLV